MPRDLARTKPQIEEAAESSGLDEFKPVRTGRVTKEVSSGIKPGWSSDRRPKSSGGDKIPLFKVPDDGEEVLIKFLDEVPFAPVFQHWIMVDTQRRAYTCIYEEDEDTGKVLVNCPLCDRGDRAKASDWFNVVELGDNPELKVWKASGDPSQAIKDKAEIKRYSPINRDELYWAISKKKAANGFNTYSVDAVKEAELVVDWGVQYLTPERISKFNKEKYDSSIVRMATPSELSEIAKKHLSDD
jgi:hypothetical protein